MLLDHFQEANLATFALYMWVKPSSTASITSYSHLAIDISGSSESLSLIYEHFAHIMD